MPKQEKKVLKWTKKYFNQLLGMRSTRKLVKIPNIRYKDVQSLGNESCYNLMLLRWENWKKLFIYNGSLFHPHPIFSFWEGVGSIFRLLNSLRMNGIIVIIGILSIICTLFYNLQMYIFLQKHCKSIFWPAFGQAFVVTSNRNHRKILRWFWFDVTN